MRRRLGLFEAVGVELEYMIVDAETLDVRPMADELLQVVAGTPDTEVERGAMAWSNELVLHVLELKTNGPAPGLGGLAAKFRDEVRHANALLAPMGARLMPGGMHPWMDPATETRLWPHEYNTVYRTFDRIFGCSGHGWANLQSTHLNLPFNGDEEFRVLHAAIRALLPLVPALTAASPVYDGGYHGALDGRVEAYRKNARRVPSVTGLVIPEVARSREEYETQILGRIYKDLEALDPEGILRHEWVNARGAIARFDRGAIEIRLVDAQEGPTADLAVTAAIHGAVKRLTLNPPAGVEGLEALETERLAALLNETARTAGDTALIDDADYLHALGIRRVAATAREVWRHLIEEGLEAHGDSHEWTPHLDTVLRQGSLARRILSALHNHAHHVGPVQPADLKRVWGELCACMAEDRTFSAPRHTERTVRR